MLVCDNSHTPTIIPWISSCWQDKLLEMYSYPTKLIMIRRSGSYNPMLRNTSFYNVTPSLISQTRGNGCAQFSSPYVSIDINWIHQNIHTHHIIISVMIIIHAMLTPGYFMMSHATLILYYHTSMLTLHTSLISCALLVATCMMLGRLECMHIDTQTSTFCFLFSFSWPNGVIAV